MLFQLIFLFSFVNKVNSGTKTASSQLFSHQGPLPYEQASQVCSKLGDGWYLPNGDINSESLLDYMRDNTIRHAWLSLEKENFGQWKWVNGTEYTSELIETPGSRCAGVAIQGRKLRPMICAEKGNGFVCEMPDKYGCPLKEHRQNCFTIGSKLFHLGCFTESWFHARSYCSNHEGDLAVLDTVQKQRAVLDYIIEKKYVGKCSWIFAGLRKEDWYAEPNHTIPRNPRWASDQPRVEHSCARIDSKGACWSHPCEQLNPVVCQNYGSVSNIVRVETSFSAILGEEKSPNAINPWMVAFVALVLLVVIGVIAAVACLQKKRQSERSPKQWNEWTIGSSTTNIVIFSSAEIMQEIEQPKRKILNIDLNKEKGKATRMELSSKTVDIIERSYRKLEKEKDTQIVNIHFKEYSNFLPDQYVIDILRRLLDQTGVIQTVLLPRFDKNLTQFKHVLSMLWDLREKVILVCAATPMPSLPACEILAVGEHAVVSNVASGNVDFVLSHVDPEVTLNGPAYVRGLAAAIKVVYSEQITGARTMFMRHLFLDMVLRDKTVYNGFGTLDARNFQLPNRKQIDSTKKSIGPDGNFPRITQPFPYVEDSNMDNVKLQSPSTENKNKIIIGLLRPGSPLLDNELSKWTITQRNSGSETSRRNQSQDDELHTIINTLLHLKGKWVDFWYLQNTIEIRWYSVYDEGWRYKEEASQKLMDDIMKCHVVYISNIMYKPSIETEQNILKLSHKCVVVTQAMKKQENGEPCKIPADRVISFGQKLEDLERVYNQNQMTVASPQAALLAENRWPDRQARGSTLDFLCGFDFEDQNVQPANFQGVAVVAMILIKASMLGLDKRTIDRVCTTQVMHAILRQMASHPQYHTKNEGWGELLPQAWLEDDASFKALIQHCAHPNYENKYWAGKNV